MGRYESYPESKFHWAVKKKQEYITNHVYCNLMYVPLLFNIISTIVEALVIALHQFFNPFIVE